MIGTGSVLVIFKDGVCSCSKNLSELLQQTQMVHEAAAATAAAKSLQSCPTLCDPIDGSPPGSPIPGILQARTLEWESDLNSRANA